MRSLPIGFCPYYCLNRFLCGAPHTKGVPLDAASSFLPATHSCNSTSCYSYLHCAACARREWLRSSRPSTVARTRRDRLSDSCVTQERGWACVSAEDSWTMPCAIIGSGTAVERGNPSEASIGSAESLSDSIAASLDKVLAWAMHRAGPTQKGAKM
eukprot:702926-Pleurochrysis_carterae.AAC.1